MPDALKLLCALPTASAVKEKPQAFSARKAIEVLDDRMRDCFDHSLDMLPDELLAEAVDGLRYGHCISFTKLPCDCGNPECDNERFFVYALHKPNILGVPKQGNPFKAFKTKPQQP